MASKRSTIQTKLAAAMLKKAQKADGDTVALVHEGAASVNLTASIGPATLNPVDAFGNSIDGELRQFEIPLQTSFTGALTIGDELTWNSLLYVITGVSVDKWGSVYTVSAVYSRHTRVKA